MIGPGKYDEACTNARIATAATGGVLLIVLDGRHGSGFSAQLSLEAQQYLPTMLREVATQIESGRESQGN